MTIFHGKKYTDAFLLGLEEAHLLFGLEILAYCLMGNHYHLLLKTPRGNLSRCMRHINGVYTQRYNKLKKTDGPLFRGRFKAILVDVDNYLLHVSRYIHRNPIETQEPLVENLIDYVQSSYPAYVDQIKPPFWLHTSFVLSTLDQNQKSETYRAYVEESHEEEFLEFYNGKNPSVVLGSKQFIAKIEQYVERNMPDVPRAQLPNVLTMELIVKRVAEFYKIPVKQILTLKKGKAKHNIPRRISMYLCRYKLGLKLTEIATHFNLTHYSSVGTAIKKMELELRENEALKKMLDILSRDLTP